MTQIDRDRQRLQTTIQPRPWAKDPGGNQSLSTLMIGIVLFNPTSVQRYQPSDRLAAIQNLNFPTLADFSKVG